MKVCNMPREVKQTCNEKQYAGIIGAVDKVRKSSATVKVDVKALKALLDDHGNLWDFHDKSTNVNIKRAKESTDASDLI